MKKIFELLLSAMLLLSCTAMAATYTAGDYTVTVDGHNGTVTLTVTTSDTAITAITTTSMMLIRPNRRPFSSRILLFTALTLSPHT